MVEFEFKCPQCGETVIADETLCGQVQLCPNCEKGIVVPRNIPKTQSIDVEYKADVTANCQVKLKPIKRQTENTPIPQSDDGRRLSEFERMCIREQERRIREKRQTLLITSIKATVVVILICTVGVFAFSWWQQRKQEEFRIKQEEIRREIAIREQKIQEEARLAKESAEKAEKASRAFHAYLDKEEARLKNVVEEAKIEQEKIGVDQQELMDELEKLEKENERRAENCRKRNEKYYDKATRVLLVLQSQVIGRMFDKYLGEDMVSIRAKYESEVKTIIQLHKTSTKKLQKNRDEYYQSVTGIDKDVDRKNERAQTRIYEVAREAEQNLRELLKRRDSLDKERKNIERDLMNKDKKRRMLEEIDERSEQLTLLITQAQTDAKAARAQVAHIEATFAETSARKRYDRAQSIRSDKDNDVHSDGLHESNVFLVAGRYEQNTLGKLREAMRQCFGYWVSRSSEAKKKLDYITRSTVNIDIMKAEEIEELRKRVVAQLTDDVAGKPSDTEKEARK